MKLHGLSIDGELEGFVSRLGMPKWTACDVGDREWRSLVAGVDLTLATSPWHTTDPMTRIQRDQAVEKLAKFALGAPTAYWKTANPVEETVVGFWDGRRFVGEFFKLVKMEHPLAGDKGPTQANVVYGLGLRPAGPLTLPDNLQAALSTVSYRGPVQIGKEELAATMPAELLALMLEILPPAERFNWLYDLAAGVGRPLPSRSVVGLRVIGDAPTEAAQRHCWGMGEVWFACSYGDAPREAAKRLEKVLSGFSSSAEYRVDGPKRLKEKLNGN